MGFMQSLESVKLQSASPTTTKQVAAGSDISVQTAGPSMYNKTDLNRSDKSQRHQTQFYQVVSRGSLNGQLFPVLSLQRSPSGSSGDHVTHFHISSQFVQLVQPDLLLLGESVTGPLHLHNLEKRNSNIYIFHILYCMKILHHPENQGLLWFHLVAVV